MYTPNMRIGISALHVRPGKSGSHEPYMVHLVQALSSLETQHHFTLFVTPANRHLFDHQRDNFDLVVYPKLTNNVFPRIGFEQLILPLDAIRRKIQVLHYGGTTSSLFIRKCDVVTIHNDPVTQRMSMNNLKYIYFHLLLHFNRRAGYLIIPSQTHADQLVNYFRFNPNRIRIVHHGILQGFRPLPEVEIKNARNKWGIEAGAVLSVTSSLPHKNAINLLMAQDYILSHYSINPQLILVGNIDQIWLDQTIDKFAKDPEKLRSRIKLIPFLENNQLPPIYNAAKIFAFVSFTETFGMPLIEAMACGLPVVASDIPVHREVCQGAAMMVDPHDYQEIAHAIHDLLTNDKTSSHYNKLSKERSKAFSWQETARRTLQVYEEALHN
jgi:glycosyltransferase involved in cell wall biosynthesis